MIPAARPAAPPRRDKGRRGHADMRKRLLIPVAACLALRAGAGAAEGGETVRGIIDAAEKARLAAEISAPVTRMPFREGERFRKGEVLAAFDCRLLEAALRAARAHWRARMLAAKSKKRLVRFQAAGKLDAAMADAESEKARAEADAAAIRAGQCRVLAPYDGRVAERHVREHETPAAGAALISIVGTGRLEVQMIAPSKWLAWIRPGDAFTFRIDETGGVAKGRLERIGAAVDAVSQTVRLHGVLGEVPEGTLPGMSGTAEFARRKTARSAPAGDDGGGS